MGKKGGGGGEEIFARLLPFPSRLSKRKAEGGFGGPQHQSKARCWAASGSERRRAGFLIGGFAQRVFELRPKNTVLYILHLTHHSATVPLRCSCEWVLFSFKRVFGIL